MENPGAVTFLALMAATVTIVYLAIRRRWLPLMTIAIVGCVLNSLWFLLFSLARALPFDRALTGGAVIGILVTSIAAAAAAFFRNNDPARDKPDIPHTGKN